MGITKQSFFGIDHLFLEWYTLASTALGDVAQVRNASTVSPPVDNKKAFEWQANKTKLCSFVFHSHSSSGRGGFEAARGWRSRSFQLFRKHFHSQARTSQPRPSS